MFTGKRFTHCQFTFMKIKNVKHWFFFLTKSELITKIIICQRASSDSLLPFLSAVQRKSAHLQIMTALVTMEEHFYMLDLVFSAFLHNLIESTMMDSPVDYQAKQGKLHHHLHFIDRKNDIQRCQSTQLRFKSSVAIRPVPPAPTPRHPQSISITSYCITELDKTCPK